MCVFGALGDVESNMAVFRCEIVLFQSIMEQAQMMAWTGSLEDC